MTMPGDPIIDPAEGGDVTTQLIAAVRDLHTAVLQLATRLRWVVVGGIVTLMVAAVTAMLFAQLRATQQEQARTRKEVLCPLYSVFLNSYNPDSAAAKADPVRYEEAFRVIRVGAEALNCPPKP